MSTLDRDEHRSAVTEDQRSVAVIESFEAAWHRGEAPVLIDAVEQLRCSATDAAEITCELIAIDMEYRWRANRAGRRLPDALGGQPRLDDYPPHRRSDAASRPPVWLIAEEYRVRTVWGDGPTHDHFFARYPGEPAALLAALKQVDAELLADDIEPAVSARRMAISPSGFDPRAPLPHEDFLLHQLLGAGGMGKIYRATQRSLERQVAVKALLKSRQADAASVERFLQEARILAGLRHPHIVGVHGLGRFPGGGHFLVMDYIEGKSLQAQLGANEGPITKASDIVRIVSCVAEAIQYAHAHGVLHCDLKPANVLLDHAGHVFVSDFGFAELVSPDVPTDVHSRGGTRAYMAPEQFGAAALGPPVDVYGIGGILYAMLTGRPPQRSSGDVIVPPNAKCDNVPTPLSDLCQRCLAEDPGDRPPSAEAIRRLLGEAT